MFLYVGILPRPCKPHFFYGGRWLGGIGGTFTWDLSNLVVSLDLAVDDIICQVYKIC